MRYQGKTGGEAMMWCAAAESSRNSAHPQAMLTSKSVAGAAGFDPGGPVMNAAVTGRANEVARAITATACAACRTPITRL